jgi:hypothetical protein
MLSRIKYVKLLNKIYLQTRSEGDLAKYYPIDDISREPLPQGKFRRWEYNLTNPPSGGSINDILYRKLNVT